MDKHNKTAGFDMPTVTDPTLCDIEREARKRAWLMTRSYLYFALAAVAGTLLGIALSFALYGAR